MAAPQIQTTRGSVTHTLTPVGRDGFEIRGSVTQLTAGGDWSVNLNTAIVDRDAVDDNDESWRAGGTETIPFNEAPGETEMLARLQSLVDGIFDRIPVPTPPPAP